jgi:hypothetical protein
MLYMEYNILYLVTDIIRLENNADIRLIYISFVLR